MIRKMVGAEEYRSLDHKYDRAYFVGGRYIKGNAFDDDTGKRNQVVEYTCPAFSRWWKGRLHDAYCDRSESLSLNSRRKASHTKPKKKKS